MIISEKENRNNHLIAAAQSIMTAARTAPKGKGRDTLDIIAITGEDIESVATQMELIAAKSGQQFFVRDAANLRTCGMAILIGTAIQTLGLPYCGCCGEPNCSAKAAHPMTPCVFNTLDMGIALGAAAAQAADLRVDSRIMYTVGIAAREIGLLREDIEIACALLLSISAKSPFFDR